MALKALNKMGMPRPYSALDDDVHNHRHGHDHVDDGDSSTEVDEEWDGEVGGGGRRRKRTTFWGLVRRWWWLLDTVLLVVIVGLLVEKRWDRGDEKQKKSKWEVGGDITGFAPSFSQQIVSFKPDPVFAPEEALKFWSPETQQAWLDIVPAGLGYVDVKDPSHHDNLPNPIHDYPNNTVFTTSMTHQLHCLYTILEAYNTMSVTLDQPGTSPNPIKMPWHINHCFEYMRQAIMCAGDVALEGAATTFPPGEHGQDQGGSDGWDARHVCKDYGQVTAYLEERAINHVKWISSEH